MGNNWFEHLKLKKRALDKLNESELQGQFPPYTDGPTPPGGDAPPADPSMGGAAPPGASGATMDPAMMGLPEEPLVWNNKYLINPIKGGPEFIVELTPSLVNKPMSMPGMPPPAGPPPDPMADPTLNPDADPNGLSQWMNQQNDGNDKPYSPTDSTTEDPLARQDEGLPPISDVGNEQNINPKVDVHKKKASPDDAGNNAPIKSPGANRGNAFMPCAACANYIAIDNECSQGLDVEKVQAAKSCAWLNSNFTPFNVNDSNDPEQSHQDKDTVKSDISDMSGGGGAGGGGAPSKFASQKQNLKDYLKKMWR